MFKNYFKLSLKVLSRRKFFTFISLFGISFTLMIFMLLTAFMETEFGANPPMSAKEKMLFLPGVNLQKMRTDTVMVLDSTYLNDQLVYDTTYEYKEKESGSSFSEPSYYFLNKYFREIKSAEKYSFYHPNNVYNCFLNSGKITFFANMTDENFWSIYDFDFVQGRPYQKKEVENQAQVAVLTQKTCRKYFGTEVDVLGKELFLEGKRFSVIGVVKDVLGFKPYVTNDLFLPYTNLMAEDLQNPDFLGGFEAVYLAKNAASVKTVRKEIHKMVSFIEEMPVEYVGYNKTSVKLFNYEERYADDFYDESEDPAENLNFVFWLVATLLAFFIILPILNLINLNISRIMERSAEIGVRKAFGASSANILFQFVFENIILTFLGGLIGLILALLMMKIINDSNFLYNTTLVFNYKIFLYSVLGCLAFGILSGLLPAYKMSKVHIVNALKQNQR